MILKSLSLSHQELFTHEGLTTLDDRFINFLEQQASNLTPALIHYRTTGMGSSEFLIDLAQQLDHFLAFAFDIEAACTEAKNNTLQHNPVGLFKKQFVLTKVKKRLHTHEDLPSFASLHTWLLHELNQYAIYTQDLESAVAELSVTMPDTSTLVDWCVQALRTPEGRAMTQSWSSLRLPEKIDYQQLISPITHYRHRDGFALTDSGMNAREIQNEIHYCIYCHDHQGDRCSKGFPDYKKNPLGVSLVGCPLEEKISEMHLLKRDGYTIAALAMVMVDNPMCPATGHRICNDCMKSCIYQKFTPVNIPEIETRVLKDVLQLPWGVEIYDLLTRWNPLRKDQWIQKPYNHRKIMIAGMGPAGFTLAHHLLQEGCAVVGFDGLKIEPLPQRYLDHPIYSFDELSASLEDRIVMGFGGVAEYGITTRWNKQFLLLLYITLMRRPYFQVFGTTRFGGTVTIEDAWALGCDHLVIAVGAGLPKALPVKNSLAPGMRQANDFLMALQLTGAAKHNHTTTLHVRLPAVVIGGGLTAIDAATEVQAYYIRQVELMAERQQEVLPEFLEHARQIKAERERAQQVGEAPNLIELVKRWGGVTIAYRKTMQESPAYLLNHEELQEALEEGVAYEEHLNPTEVILDEGGHAEGMKFQHALTQEIIVLPARCILVATGASLNVAYAFEHPESLERKGLQYLHFEETEGTLIVPHVSEHCKHKDFGPFTSYQDADGHRVSFIGDTHPVFHGSVVKAIASAKAAYPKIMAHLQHLPLSTQPYQTFHDNIRARLLPQIVHIHMPRDGVTELTLRAPQAIAHWQPGHLYRIQPYETFCQYGLIAEPEIVMANRVDAERGEITVTLLKPNPHYRVGDPAALMGPTGVRCKVSTHHEHVLIMGNTSGLVHVQSYGRALKAAGNHVTFIGYLPHKNDVFRQSEIESIADLVIWIVTEGEAISPLQNTTISLQGEPIDALAYYMRLPAFQEVDRIQIIGNAALLKAVKALRCDKASKQPKIYGSVNVPMQCMLKGVCAQCLTWQIDPETGLRKKAVFACSWQNQPLELIDMA